MRQDVNPLVKTFENVHEHFYEHYVKSISRSRTLWEVDENGILKQKTEEKEESSKKENGEIMFWRRITHGQDV